MNDLGSRFSCDCSARSSATPSRQRRASVNEDTAETSVLRGLARLNRLSLIWLTQGKCEQTEEMRRQALGPREAVLGNQHPSHPSNTTQPQGDGSGVQVQG